MTYAHSCPDCNPAKVLDASTEHWHSIYMEWPITYGYKADGKRCWHANQMQEETLAALKARIRHIEN